MPCCMLSKVLFSVMLFDGWKTIKRQTKRARYLAFKKRTGCFWKGNIFTARPPISFFPLPHTGFSLKLHLKLECVAVTVRLWNPFTSFFFLHWLCASINCFRELTNIYIYIKKNKEKDSFAKKSVCSPFLSVDFVAVFKIVIMVLSRADFCFIPALLFIMRELNFCWHKTCEQEKGEGA